MMTKSATLGHLAQKTNLSKKQIAEVFDEVLNLATKEAKNGFVVPGFGKLVLANRKARIGRNPQTGEPIKIPAKRVCKFRLARRLKDTVLGKKWGGRGAPSRLAAGHGPGRHHVLTRGRARARPLARFGNAPSRVAGCRLPAAARRRRGPPS